MILGTSYLSLLERSHLPTHSWVAWECGPPGSLAARPFPSLQCASILMTVVKKIKAFLQEPRRPTLVSIMFAQDEVG